MPSLSYAQLFLLSIRMIKIGILDLEFENFSKFQKTNPLALLLKLFRFVA